MDESQLVTSQLVMQLSMACPIFRSNVQSDTIHQNTIARFPRYLKKAPKIDDCSQRLRKDGEKGKKRKVEKRIFWETVVGRRSGIKGGPNVFSRPVFIVCVPTWPVKTAFNSSQFTRLLRKEERNPEDVRRPAAGIERNSEWLFAVP